LQKRIAILRRNNSIDFLIRFFFLAIVATLTAIFGYPVFGTTDDNILAGFVDGSYTGERESKLIFIRPLIGSILHIIQGLLPNLGVYSLFLVLIVITSLANIGALTSLYSKNDVSTKVFDTSWLILSISITTWFTLGPTYTSASMLVTLISLLSLIILIFSEHRKSLYLNTIFSTILLSIGFLIRPEGGIGVILVTTPVIVLIFFQNRHVNFSKLFISLLGFFMIFGVDALIQNQSNSSGWKEYDKWNNLRHQIQHRVSQEYLDDFQQVNGWTVPEYHLFMDIAFGDERTFNAEWISPAYKSTSFTRGLQGVINADVIDTLNKIIKIFKSYPYIFIIQVSIFLIILSCLRTNVLSKFKIVLVIYSGIIASLYYMSATLHTPERGVVPVLYAPTLMILASASFFGQKENLSIIKVRFFGIALVTLSILAPNGLFDIRTKNIIHIESAVLAGSELNMFSKRAIYIGPGNSEFYEFRNPYTNLAYWDSPTIITAGNWETFSPHWYKRLNAYDIDKKSIYEELFNENRFWFGSQLPDTAYIVELFLREGGLTELSRQGVLNLKSGYVLHKFEQ
jgi:hypothetical protein